MECLRVQRILWTDGTGEPVASHLEECDGCRAEARRMGQLRTALADLAAELPVPRPELEPALLALVERSRLGRARDLVVHPRFWRGAAWGAAAATAAAFGVLVARRIIRPDLVA